MLANSPADVSFYVFAPVWLMCSRLWSKATGQLINDFLKRRSGLIFKINKPEVHWSLNTGPILFSYCPDPMNPAARNFIREEQINLLTDFATEGILNFARLIILCHHYLKEIFLQNLRQYLGLICVHVNITWMVKTLKCHGAVYQ